MVRYEYIVTGNAGYFPLDMLRYDACWPHRSIDVTQISAGSRDYNPGTKANIRLSGVCPPTLARWNSFGWSVGKVEKIRY